MATRLKKVISQLISSDQTAYVPGRFIGESVRLISDVLEHMKTSELPGYFITTDIEKAFDSVDHTFLVAVLKKFGFGDDFIRWVRIILNRQESCIMNNGHSTGYFPLSSGTRQGDPISAYLFILVMEIIFIQVCTNPDIKGLTLFGYELKLTSFADDMSYFHQDLKSIKELLWLVKYSEQFTSLKVNYEKSEICGIGYKKGVMGAFSNITSVDIVNDTVKILACHHSYNKQLADDRNFLDTVANIQSVLNLWSWRGLSLLGKIQIFKTLGISKIQYLASMPHVPDRIIQELETIQSRFLWNSSTPKIKHSTLFGDYAEEGLKNVDINTKLKAMKLTWVRRLSDDNYHPWKVLPREYLTLPNGDSVFHRNFESNPLLLRKLNSLPTFYKDLLRYWSEVSHCDINCAELILPESLWYNTFIKIHANTVYFEEFSLVGINKVKDLFEKDGKLKEFDKLRQDNPFLSDRLHFKWTQLIDSIPLDSRTKIRDNTTPDEVCMSKYGLYYYSHSGLHLVDLSCKAMYSKLLKQTLTEPTSVQYWETKLNVSQRGTDWRKVFLIPRISMIESYTRSFQYKILNNALFLNKRSFKFGVIESPACSFCGQVDESPIHFFGQCSVTVELWKKLQRWLTPSFVLPDLTLENALLGYIPIISDNGTTAKTVNHILLIFKRSLYEMRSRKVAPSIFYIMNKIKQIRDIEYQIAKKSDKLTLHFNKWDLLNLQVVNP